jgi:2-iminobutanoate/2-iminopropanoate deaminase
MAGPALREERTAMKELITSAGAPAPSGPFSPGLRVGGLIFLSGQGGFDPGTGQLVGDDIAGQTAQAFHNIEALLHAAGASLGDVVSCLVHVSDLAQLAEFNASYAEHFPGPVKPVRTTVRADLIADMRVEVTVIASKPEREHAHGGT